MQEFIARSHSPSGHIYIGIRGFVLTAEECQWLCHPLVAGVILFSRNYESKAQLMALTASIKTRRSDLLISVDHEGGRVQRFRSGFTPIPAMRTLGELYDKAPLEAIAQGIHWGEVIAAELSAVGIDFSYVPVCDLDYGVNAAIGDRAFHSVPEVVSLLTLALYEGLKNKGTMGVAKHFPGHGFVGADTHLACAVDERSLATLMAQDLVPFKALIAKGIEAIMPAHIIYPCIDDAHTVVSSLKWTQFLREQLGFQGLLISDDLDMKGADHLGTPVNKINACFAAGMDIVLCCNDFEAIEAIVEYF